MLASAWRPPLQGGDNRDPAAGRTRYLAEMGFDLYVWSDPRDLEPDEAAVRAGAWEDAGADPVDAPFEPSTNVAWCFRELLRDLPAIDVVSDAAPPTNRRPIVLQTDAAGPGDG